MAAQPTASTSRPGGSPKGHGLVFHLRLGLLIIGALTLAATIMALWTFRTTSAVLEQITAEAMPTIKQANHLQEIIESLDSQARNLPNLHTPFAIAATRYELRRLGLEFEAALAKVDPSVVSHGALEEVQASFGTMNREMDRLSLTVERRSALEEKQIQQNRQADSLFHEIQAIGKFAAADPAWLEVRAQLTPGLFRIHHLLIASLATTEPDQVLANQNEFDRQISAVRALLPDLAGALKAQTLTILGDLESCKSFIDDRLSQLQLDFRIRNTAKGLAIMDRLNQQVRTLTATLTSQATAKGQAVKVTVARMRWVLSGLAVLYLSVLFTVLIYINRRIMRRIKALQSAMVSHVEGVPQPVDISGTDEVSDMAASFMFYVNQAEQRAHSLEERTRELNEALGSLMEKTSVLNTTMQSIQQGLIMVDQDLKVVSYNDNLARLFDPEGAPMVGMPDFKELHQHLYSRAGEGDELLQQCLERAHSQERLTFEQHLSDGRILEIHQKPLAEGGFVRTYTDITERKKAEEALRESERRLADIIEFLPDPTFVLDGEGRVAAWNQAMEDLTGLRNSDMIGKGDYEYALPFYGERRPLLADLVRFWDEDYTKTYRSMAWKGDRLHMESFHPHMGQGGMYLSGTARALHDSSGNQTGAIESLRDVTERRRVEERYETMAANVPGAIFEAKVGPEGALVFTYVSPGCQEHFNVSPDDLISGRQDLAIHPDDRPGFQSAVEQAVREGCPLEFVGQLAAPPGQRRWIRVVAKLSRGGAGGDIFYGLMLDVTKRKLAEMENLASERKLSAMSTAVEDALIILDSQDRVRFWNPAAEKLFGYTPEEAQQLNLHDVVAPADVHGQVQEGLKRFAETGEGRVIGATIETKALKRHGETFPVELSISSYQVDGEWLAVGTARDITKRKEAEEEVKRYVEELERFNQLAIGREERMIVLKAEINRLLEELGRGPKYNIVDQP